MTTETLTALCLALGLTSALVGGVFGAFSTFVMGGLRQAAPEAGIETMQRINVTVFRSLFLYAFFALVPASLVLAVFAVTAMEGAARTPIIAAAAIYLGAVFLVTVFGNVPMNERLARLDPQGAEAQAYWVVYGRDWTRWNYLRMLGSAATAVCYLFAASVLD